MVRTYIFLNTPKPRTADDEEYRILQTCTEYICGHNLGDLLTTASTSLNLITLIELRTFTDNCTERSNATNGDVAAELFRD